MNPEYFERQYAGAADPWGLRSRWYEQRKYALTMAMLPRPRYRLAFEPGCSVGVLTQSLAARCDRVVATDIVDSALATARADNPGVEFRRWALGSPWPEEMFDLVVLSEVGYYLDAPALEQSLADAVRHLEARGTLAAAHWRHPVPEHLLSGDAVHDLVRGTAGLARVGHYVDADVRIEVFEHASGAATSVAAADGLV